jgi:hypothetical protein
MDSSLGRDTRLSYIIVSQEWIWPTIRSPEWFELIRCTSDSLLPDDSSGMLCVGKMLHGVYSPFVMFGIPSTPFGTRLSGGHLFGINKQSCGSPSSYGLLSVKYYWLGIGLCPLVSLGFTVSTMWGWLWGYWPLVFQLHFLPSHLVWSLFDFIERLLAMVYICDYQITEQFPYICDYQINVSHNGLLHLEGEECSTL